jgi:hypothetical protein
MLFTGIYHRTRPLPGKEVKGRNLVPAIQELLLAFKS